MNDAENHERRALESTLISHTTCAIIFAFSFPTGMTIIGNSPDVIRWSRVVIDVFHRHQQAIVNNAARFDVDGRLNVQVAVGILFAPVFWEKHCRKRSSELVSSEHC